MHTRTLLRCLLLTLFASSLPHAFASTASAQEMEFTPILDGGVRWTVFPDGISYLANPQSKVSVKRTEDAITYLLDTDEREGCLLATPWIPSTGKRSVLVFPGIDISLNLYSRNEMWRWPHENLVEIHVVTRYPRKATPSSPIPYTFVTQKGMISRDDVPVTVTHYPSPLNGTGLVGKRSSDVNSLRPIVINTEVDRDADIAIRICNLNPMDQLNIRNITVETLPLDD